MTKPKYQSKKAIYLIGSLRNYEIPKIAEALRDENTEIFDNWISAGEAADDAWRDYERGRGHTYEQALKNHSARHVYSFDYFHLNRCHAAILALPAGKSGHLEAGFMAGQGKPVFLLLDGEAEPERLDVMTQFLSGVCDTVDALRERIHNFAWPKLPELPMVTLVDAVWLAGVLEGDGTFCISDGNPRLLLQMTDRDTVEHAARILASAVWQHPPTVAGKPVFACGAAGLRGVEWMRILMPYMSLRRQEQIRASVVDWLDHRRYRKQDAEWWLRMFNLKERTRR